MSGFEFESPRFAGDQLLHDILNDPDTGTMKLQPGSPAESVTLLQQALWDLWWPSHVDPPISQPADVFVDGDYGGGTTATVLRYKKQYDIHFPPSAPTGLIDGLAGPRTLRLLDRHCVLLDELDAMITAKAATLGAFAAQMVIRTLPFLGTMGAMRGVHLGEETFFVYAKRGLGAFAARGAIGDVYIQRHDGPKGPFGFSVGDTFDEAPGVSRQDFEFGSLRSSAATGLVESVGPMPSTPVQF